MLVAAASARVLADSRWVGLGSSSAIDNIEQYYSSFTSGLNDLEAAADLNASIASVRDSVDPIITEISSTFNNLQTYFVDNRNLLQGKLSVADMHIDNLNTSLTGFQDNMLYVDSQMSAYSEHR